MGCLVCSVVLCELTQECCAVPGHGHLPQCQLGDVLHQQRDERYVPCFFPQCILNLSLTCVPAVQLVL